MNDEIWTVEVKNKIISINNSLLKQSNSRAVISEVDVDSNYV